MRRLVLFGFAAALAAAPAALAQERSAGEDSHAPKKREMSYIYDLLDHSAIRPITRRTDVALMARKLAGQPREAANVDENDEVRLPSTWWQPRVGYRTVTPEQLLHGPGPGSGPAPGKWTITEAKGQGVSYGFQIEDSRGDKYIVKLDHKGVPEQSSAASAIGSRLFWAAGYNVPDDAVAYFSLDDIEIGKDAKQGKKPLTMDGIRAMLAKVEQEPDGRYRCITSRFLAGKPLGPFRYRGRRTDDPEDRIPHQLRRELRGLWVLCAWTHHTDSRAPNSLDMWVTDGGRSFVRHHLIDFGSTLGTGPDGKSHVAGTEYYVDYGVAGRQIATAGLSRFRWEAAESPKLRGIGSFESKTFTPEGWRPDYPNPAFDEKTERDIRWGARIIASFTDEHIRAAVSAGRFSDPRAAEYMARTLMERRDKIVARWLGNGSHSRPQIVSR